MTQLQNGYPQPPSGAPVPPPGAQPAPPQQQAAQQPPAPVQQQSRQQSPPPAPNQQPASYPQPPQQSQQQAPRPPMQQQPPRQPMQQPAPQPGAPQRYHVHHTYLWLGGVQVVLSLFIVMVFALFPVVIGEELSQATGRSLVLVVGGLIVLFIVIVGLVFVVQYFSYKNLFYEIGTEEFSLYSGILNKKRVHVPYQRVQSVNQKATLVQRIFGVCTVNIDTAGGASNKAVVIPYIQNTEAERLRAELFARKQAALGQSAPGQPQTASVQAAPAPQSVAGAQPAAASQAYAASTQQAAAGAPGVSNVLDAPAEIISDVRGVFGGSQLHTGAVSYEYGLSNKELVFTGLSNNTSAILVILAVVGSAVGIITQILETSIGKELVNQGISVANQAFAGQMVWALIAGFVGLFLFIWVVSIIGACISYGGFRACRRQSRIEVEHGLLQHRFHGVDIDRVQSVIVKQSFIRRILGYCELSLGKVDALTEGSSEQEQALNRQGLIIHPFVKLDRVPEILAGLVPEFADVPTDQIKLPQVALRRVIIRRCFLLGNGFWLAVIVAIVQILANLFIVPDSSSAQTALFYINVGAAVLYVLCAIILVLDAIGAVLWFRGSGFAFNKRFMQVSNGGFSRESVSFPRKKMQYGYTKTNPFQRMAHVATINARTAAGVGGTTFKLLDVSEKDAEQWLDWARPGRSMVK